MLSILFLPAALLIVAGCARHTGQQTQTAPSPDSFAQAPAATAHPEVSETLDLRQSIITRSVGADSVQIIDATCIVAFPPTLAEAAEAREEGTGDDFEAAADDYTFYFNDVIERAELAHIPIVDASRRFLRFVISEGSSVLIDSRAAGPGTWNPILFRKGAPPVIYQLVGDSDTNRIRNFFGK
jgi:hypothetical protein